MLTVADGGVIENGRRLQNRQGRAERTLSKTNDRLQRQD